MRGRRELTVGVLRAAALRVATITAVLVIMVSASPVHADNVDTLIKQLEDDSDKVRLSAALNLAKLGDQRAILALVKRVNADTEDDKNVRGAAAVGLGKLAGGAKSASIKNLAVKALQKAEAADPSDFVKQQAKKALQQLGAATGTDTTAPPSGGSNVYVNIGPMASETGTDDAKYRTLMGKIASTTMTKTAPSMVTAWPGGGLPNKAALAKGGYQGFYVGGTLNELKVEKSGSSATVSCKISMLLASFPDKAMFGFLNGGAKVQGSASARDIAMASEDCVSAIVEDLIAKKIVPTIKSKVP